MHRARIKSVGHLLLLSACACSLSAPCPAQNPPAAQPAQSSTETARALNGQAAELYGRQQYDAARGLYERALALAREQKDVGAEAFALRGLGMLHQDRAEYPAALDCFEKARVLSESISDTLGIAHAIRFLGGVHYYLGDRPKSLDYYRQALPYFEQAGDLRTKAYLLRDITFSPLLKKEERLGYLRQALAIGKQLDDKQLQGLVLHNWADWLAVEGDFAESNEKLTAAATLLEEVGDRESLAPVFTSTGRLLRLHGQPERALEFYERALKIQQELGDRRGVVQSYNAMGVAYNAMEDYRQAGECYQRAYDLAVETGSERIIDFMKGALASNYVKLGEYARAAELLEQVIARGKDSSLDYRYASLAAAYYYLGRYSDALTANEKALSIRAQTKSAVLHDSLAARAQILAKLNRLEEAMTDVREAMRLQEEQRAKTIPADLMKRGYGEAAQLFYSVAVELLDLGGRPREALEVAEQARARAFLDLLATREVTLRAGSSAELAELRGLESSLRKQGADPSEFAAANTPALLLRGGNVASDASPALLGRWKNADLELRSFVAAEAFSADQLAATAKRLHSTILSYWVGDEATHIWVVNPDGTVHTAKSQISRERLAQLIRSATSDSRGLAARGEQESAAGQIPELPTRGAMTLRLNPASKQAWRELYDLLIRPVRAQLRKESGSRLTIIPHGPLFRVSFAALQDERGSYLIERHELHYAPAGAVLEFTRKKLHPGASRKQGGYLLVADPLNMPPGENDRKLPALPGARAEMASIARLLPAGGATTLAEAAAQENRVRAGLRGSRVIHFATHGIVRDDSPLDSFLALGASSGAPAEDGRLTVQEIYALELNADLIFLSTCRSGRGKVTGDGVVGLTRAFVYAGTPSVVASLWDVADEPTQRLVPEFYRHYLKSGNPGRSLRAAQLRLLSDLRAGRIRVSTPAGSFVLPEHPSLWAGFILLGEP